MLRGAGPAVTTPWERTNHAGRSVTLLEGPAFAVGAALGSWQDPAALVTIVGSSAVGALDDLKGGAQAKGLRGHLRAASRGQVTTGVIKIGGLALTGVAAAVLVAGRRPEPGPRSLAGRAVLTLTDGALIAGGANLANLLDLRPGRALKAVILAGAPLLGPPTPSAAAAAAVGAALGVLPPDLRGQAMLGDTGANPAGALIGLALVERLGPRGRAAALAVVVGLTLASERVSFTAVIERTPFLRELDAWGRPTPPATTP